MIEVSIVKKENSELDPLDEYYYMVDIDGIRFSSEDQYDTYKKPSISVDSLELLEVIYKYKIDELAEYFNDIDITMMSKLSHFANILLFLNGDTFLFDNIFPEVKLAHKKNLEIYIRYDIRLDILNWNKAYSVSEYVAALTDSIDLVNHDLIWPYNSIEDYVMTGLVPDYYIYYEVRNKSKNIIEELKSSDLTVKRILEEAERIVMSKVDSNTLSTLFQFPEEIQTSCEQYLLYFAQFLKDLGIDAVANIQHEAQHVLFSVTPVDGEEALEKVKEALHIYLQLPDSPEFAVEVASNHDIAMRQLEANVLHLKGQLAIAGAVIQAKEAAIEALQVSNFSYKQMIGHSSQAKQLDLAVIVEKEKEDTEALIPGMVEVTDYKGKGIKVKLPEILRKLKRRFGG